VSAQPAVKLVEAEVPGFRESDQKTVRLEVVEFNAVSVHTKEGRRDCNGSPLVPVDEGVILPKAFEQGHGLLDDVAIITAPWPGQCGFQRPSVANAVTSSEQFDEAGLGGQNFFDGRIACH